MADRRQQRTWAQHVAVILLNEIEPRVKRLGASRPPAALTSLLAGMEFDGEISRKQLRAALDKVMAA